ncbi:MAG: PAS domain-containing protein [Gammaproteobacteria bacterium]|nr:PAS domain-containing protein [Gammaproteobacteria bacterium]
MAVRQGDTNTLDLLNEGLERVRKSGDYQRIYNNWFGERILSGYTRNEFLVFSGTIAVLALLMGIGLGLAFYISRLKATQRALKSSIDDERKTRAALSRSEEKLLLLNRELEKRVQDRTRELSRSERRLRDAQSIAKIGNWEADVVTGKLVWSDEIYRIFGHDPNAFAPSVEAFHAAVHPEDLDKVHASEKEAEQGGMHDVVHRIIRPDGTIRHVHELAQSTTNSEGKLIRLLGTVQDVTEQVEVEQELIRAREEAERANLAKSQFLSRMSHELRTPMNAIMGFSHLLEVDPTLSHEQLDNVREILAASKHLLDLINELLDLARVESGNFELTLESVDLKPVLYECLALVRTLAEKHQVQVSTGDFEDVSVIADRTRLKQVLINLITNAVKYNHEGGEVTIDVSASGSDRIRIGVNDNGPGIPHEKLDELFEPFHRLGAETTDIEGSGIGMTISRQLVLKMGGELGVESELDVGTCFWFELPLSVHH